MSFQDALFTAVAKADRDGVVAALRGRTETERRAVAPAFLQRGDSCGHFKHTADGLVWHERTRLGNFRIETQQPPVVRLAILGTASMTQMRRVAWGLSWVDDDAGATVLLHRNPPWLASFAQWFLTTRTMDTRWPLVRSLVRAGAIERPEAYIPALLAMRWEPRELKAMLDGDPEFLDRDAWDMLAYAGEDGSLRAADTGGWDRALAARLDRPRLLDATLAALLDRSAYQSAWFTKLWNTLKVTRQERAERLDALRALLGAPAEPVIAFALAELGAAARPADVVPALTASSKGTVRAALKRLDGESALAAIALGHPDAGIQSDVLDRLERWGLDDAARDALLRHLDLLAATQRPRAEALLGVALPAAEDAVDVDASDIPEAIRTALNFGGPLPPAPIPGEPVLGEPVAPLDTVDEFLAAVRASYDWEWVRDAILRFCDQPAPPGLGDIVFDGEVYAWVHRELPPLFEHRGEHSVYEQRIVRGEAGPYLPIPSHMGGWIDPLVLVERMHPHVSDDELAEALFRLAPDHRAAALEAARPVPGRHGELLRCALGGDLVEGDDRVAFAARAVRLPLGTDDDPRFPAQPLAFPARRDIACMRAMTRMRSSLEDYGVDSGASEILEALLPAPEPIPPLAVRLIVLALGSIVQREHLLATDVLIAGIEDGRIDTLPIDDVGRLKPNRLAARLTNVAAAGPLQRAVVRDFLDASIDRVTVRPGPLLVLFDELCAQTHTGPRHSREHLRTLTHKAAKALVQRTGDPPGSEAQFALAARARRAYRWMQS
ncbi:DUF6493 family protein [Solirubrobacter taibaiensis]|nr:DUF6493 family protein [Solirubrobacter taibaiensis]